MSTGSAFGSSQTVAVMSNNAECDWPIECRPTAVCILYQADRLADQCLADVDGGAPPPDLAVVTDPTDRLRAGIFRLAQDAIPASRRERVVVSRRIVAEGFVRTLFIVQRGLRTPTGPFSKNYFIIGIRGSGCGWRFTGRSTRAMGSSSAAR